MEFKCIDIHSHLNIEPLYGRRAEILAKMGETGIGTITVGTDLEASKLAIQIAKECGMWATVGIHPSHHPVASDTPPQAGGEISDVWNELKSLAKDDCVVAIGECGVDYFRGAENKDEQKEIFIKHVELALELNKPLMIHARPSKGTQDAYEDVLDIIQNHHPLTPSSTRRGELRGNFHFFVGNIEVAKRALEMGFTMSFDGPITFSTDYDEVIKFLPLEAIMAETDAPFAAPAPYRGQKCEPWMVEEVVKKIAEIKGLDLEETKKQLLINTQKFFNIQLGV